MQCFNNIKDEYSVFAKPVVRMNQSVILEPYETKMIEIRTDESEDEVCLIEEPSVWLKEKVHIKPGLLSVNSINSIIMTNKQPEPLILKRDMNIARQTPVTKDMTIIYPKERKNSDESLTYSASSNNASLTRGMDGQIDNKKESDVNSNSKSDNSALTRGTTHWDTNEWNDRMSRNHKPTLTRGMTPLSVDSQCLNNLSTEGTEKERELPVDKVLEFLENFNYGQHLNREEKVKLGRLLRRFREIFKMEGDPHGKIDVVTHTIDTGDNYPVSVPLFKASPASRKFIEETVEELLINGLIEPSQSPWSAPVVLAST